MARRVHLGVRLSQDRPAALKTFTRAVAIQTQKFRRTASLRVRPRSARRPCEERSYQ